MIHQVTAIVLAQRRMGEADKGLHLYTRELGRVWARATSAAKPAAKLAGATEIFVESQLALFLRDGAIWGKVVGGRYRKLRPALWLDLNRTGAASWVCELMAMFTPERQPHPEKYDLLIDTLDRLSTSSKLTLIRLTYAIRFLAMAGYEARFNRLKQTLSSRDAQVLEAMHDWPWGAIETITWTPDLAAKLNDFVNQVLEEQLPRPMKTDAFAELMEITI